MTEQPSAAAKPDAREAILGRIRGALAGTLTSAAQADVATEVSPGYRRHGSLDPAACIELLVDRLVDYDAAVLQIDGEAELPAAIASCLRESGEHNVVVAAEFPREWLPPGIQVIFDAAPNGGAGSIAGDSIDAIDNAAAVITPCEVAVASTGTIILKHAGAQGRRVITLLPDHHICLVRRAQVVELLPEALAMLDPASPAPLTTISGPSATSDIEMTRIRGVHGPRRLSVILYGLATR